ncbi:MAG: VOC family protein [Caulobacterales bacterium]
MAAGARFDQVNIVARDVEATLEFYRRVGLEIPDGVIWRTKSGAHHASAETEGVDLEFDSHALARRYNAGFAAERGRVVIGVSLETRAAVDQAWADLIANGHQGLQPPFDAFWGARYAIVEDPDGNPVGLMSPVDPAFRSPPPQI